MSAATDISVDERNTSSHGSGRDSTVCESCSGTCESGSELCGSCTKALEALSQTDSAVCEFCSGTCKPGSDLCESCSETQESCCGALEQFAAAQKVALTWLETHWPHFQTAWWSLFICGMFVYVAYALRLDVEDSVGLLAMVGIAVLILIVLILRSECGRQIGGWWGEQAKPRLTRVWRYARWVWYVSMLVGLAVFLGLQVEPPAMISLAGLASLLLFSFLYSKDHSAVPWRTVFCGLMVQFAMGFLVLRWEPGAEAVAWLADKITAIGEFGQAGARVVFGESYEDHFWAMAVVPILAFFMGLSAMMEYYGVIQFISIILGNTLEFFMGTSAPETFVAAADIFFGPEQSIVMIRPMVREMTASQLHALMACGLASIDAGMLIFYQSFGIPPSHLLSASCMSAPAALVVAKMVFPDPRDDDGRTKKLKFSKFEARNGFDAFCQGVQMSKTIMGVLIVVPMVFISFLECFNTILIWFGDRAGLEQLSFQKVLGYILMPVSFLIGVPWEDCDEVGYLIGTKTIINEFVAYMDLAQLIQNRENGVDPQISPRSEVIASFALCGFSNFGTVGMMVGFLTSLAPDRKSDISQMAMRALAASTCACLMTACVAALLYPHDTSST